MREKKMIMTMKRNHGFTLAELLIVVAIIGVLVAIAIPVFTSQLEKSREATDIANVRSKYAELSAMGMSSGTPDESSGITRSGTKGSYVYSAQVTLEQLEDGWDTSLPITIGGVSYNGTDTEQWKNEPKAEGVCTITFEQATGKTYFDWGGSIWVGSFNENFISLYQSSSWRMSSGYVTDFWSEGTNDTKNKDLNRLNAFKSTLDAQGIDIENVSFETSWGTVYQTTGENAWKYQIAETGKLTPDGKIPAGTKFLIITIDGKVTEADAGKTVRAVAIDPKSNGKTYYGTVEVSTVANYCFNGRTKVALINFTPKVEK